jgi:integrase
LAHLRRWQRLGQRFCVGFNGERIGGVDKAFRKNAAAAGMPEVTPHTLRHTAATWLMQKSADLWATAGYLGMSVEQLERTYGHHHGDHLKSARDAADRRPGTEREQKGAAPLSPLNQRNRT